MKINELALPRPLGCTKVHAFQIKTLERLDWMNWEMGGTSSSYTAYGHHPLHTVSIPHSLMEPSNLEEGRWLVRWPTGIVTFRSDESFKRDFEPGNGTLYYTWLEGIFQRGWEHPEGQRRHAEERAAEKERQRKLHEEWMARRATEPKVRDLGNGCIVRRVDVGLVEMPKGIQVQPLSEHVSILPLLKALTRPNF